MRRKNVWSNVGKMQLLLELSVIMVKLLPKMPASLQKTFLKKVSIQVSVIPNIVHNYATL